jgi:hypothetical protein
MLCLRTPFADHLQVRTRVSATVRHASPVMHDEAVVGRALDAATVALVARLRLDPLALVRSDAIERRRRRAHTPAFWRVPRAVGSRSGSAVHTLGRASGACLFAIW